MTQPPPERLWKTHGFHSCVTIPEPWYHFIHDTGWFKVNPPPLYENVTHAAWIAGRAVLQYFGEDGMCSVDDISACQTRDDAERIAHKEKRLDPMLPKGKIKKKELFSWAVEPIPKSETYLWLKPRKKEWYEV
jgi:hypothetical protein